jgi:nicotinate phosphoribosyltransferase
VAARAPVDGFGVGAALSTSSDAPSLGAIYKLVEIERDGTVVPIRKLSPGKHTYPGRKQVWRVFENETAIEDMIELTDDAPEVPLGRPLLTAVMRGGQRLLTPQPLADVRARARAAIAELPASVRRLHQPERYPVRLGNALQYVTERASAIER